MTVRRAIRLASMNVKLFGTRPALRHVALFSALIPVAALALVAALGLGFTGVARASLGGAGAEPLHWIVDRSGGAVLGLDAGFGVVQRFARSHPVRVVSVPGADELWIASATEGFALGAHELELIRAGETRWRYPTGPVIDLDANLESAIWVEWPQVPVGPFRSQSGAQAEGQVFVADRGGAVRRLAVEGRPTSAALAVKGDRALVGREDGHVELWRTDHPPERLAIVLVAQQLGDVVLGPRDGWFVQDVAARRLIALDRTLEERWSVETGLSPETLSTSTDLEHVWIVDANEPFVRRFGPGGVLEVSVGNLPLGGFDRSAPTAGGGLVLVSPGAVLELDAAGNLLQSQGGFRFLTDVAPVR